MAEFRLYCFAQSGNAYKAALMLQLCNAEWEPRFVDYFSGETHTPEYRAINVMGEVPVLEHKNVRLAQSGVILDYLATKLGRFGPTNETERREILRWLLFDNHKLTSYTATLRFFLQFTSVKDGPVVDFLRGRSNGALAVLDCHLADRAFVIGDRPSIADLSMCGYLFWPSEFGVTWATDYPNIGAWLERIRALPAWVHPYHLMPGYPRMTES
jgi:glutathione S-transferase